MIGLSQHTSSGSVWLNASNAVLVSIFNEHMTGISSLKTLALNMFLFVKRITDLVVVSSIYISYNSRMKDLAPW